MLNRQLTFFQPVSNTVRTVCEWPNNTEDYFWLLVFIITVLYEAVLYIKYHLNCKSRNDYYYKVQTVIQYVYSK